MPRSTRRFYMLLALITAVGLAIRLFYVIGVRWDQRLWGDAFLYHSAANGLVDGFGFQLWIPKSLANPDVPVILQNARNWSSIAVPIGASAEHPPLFPIYLASWSLFGLRTYHWHMIATTMLGTASVFMMGLVGRKIAGNRVGIIAAILAAVYANFWVNDSVGTTESMGILFGAIIVLLAYRAWESPTWKRVAILGAISGLAALTRSEFVLLLPVIMIPFVVSRLKQRPIKERFLFLVVGGVAALIVVSPWVIRNLTTFKDPVFLSSAAGVSLAATSCDNTYYGPALGWWSPECVIHQHPKGDFSQQDVYWTNRAFDYMGNHLDRLPVVLAARVGRMWELYHPGSPWGPINPDQKIGFDISEGRSEVAARIALFQFYLMVPLAIAGFVMLRRRKITIAPLLALPVVSSMAALYAFGNTRYRAISEVAIVALAAIALDAIVTRYWRPDRDAAPGTSPDDARDEALQLT